MALSKKVGDEINILMTLANALAVAVEMRFMSPEHGGAIWKNHLKLSSIDSPKPQPKIKKEVKENVS